MYEPNVVFEKPSSCGMKNPPYAPMAEMSPRAAAALRCAPMPLFERRAKIVGIMR